MSKKIKIIIIIVLIVFFFPKPCGRWTTAASLRMEYNCYGIKVPSLSTGGGSLFCFGVYNPVKKEPNFQCKDSTDCMSGCGWRATHAGVKECIAVNKNSKSYLERNNLKIEEKFPIFCYRNQCTLKIAITPEEDFFETGVREVIVGFKEADNFRIEPYILYPEEAQIHPRIFLPF